MKIILNEKEVNEILLAHMSKLMPGRWSVKTSCNYSYIEKVEFTQVEKVEEPAKDSQVEEVQPMETIHY